MPARMQIEFTCFFNGADKPHALDDYATEKFVVACERKKPPAELKPLLARSTSYWILFYGIPLNSPQSGLVNDPRPTEFIAARFDVLASDRTRLKICLALHHVGEPGPGNPSLDPAVVSLASHRASPYDDVPIFRRSCRGSFAKTSNARDVPAFERSRIWTVALTECFLRLFFIINSPCSNSPYRCS